MQLVMIDGVQVMVDRNASSEAFVHGLDESRSVATIMLSMLYCQHPCTVLK